MDINLFSDSDEIKDLNLTLNNTQVSLIKKKKDKLEVFFYKDNFIKDSDIKSNKNLILLSENEKIKEISEKSLKTQHNKKKDKKKKEKIGKEKNKKNKLIKIKK